MIKKSLVVMFLVWTLLITGCDKTKALTTVRQADELSAKMLIYGRNIAKANNDSFEAGNLPGPAGSALHLSTTIAVDKYLQGVDVFIKGIDAAKKAILTGAEPGGQVNLLKALFDREVVQAALAMVSMVTTLPPGLADRIGGWMAAVQLAILSFKGLFADAQMNLQGANNYV